MDKMSAAQRLAEERYNTGWRPARLLTGGNTKLEKSERTIGLSLAPANTSGQEVCASTFAPLPIEGSSDMKIPVLSTGANMAAVFRRREADLFLNPLTD